MKVLFIGNTRLGDAILSTPILNYYNKKNNARPSTGIIIMPQVPRAYQLR